jgi:hypothetical protein
MWKFISPERKILPIVQSERSVTHASVEKQLLTSVAVNLSHAIGRYAVQCEVQTSLLRQMAGLEAMLRQRAAPLIALVTFYH